MADRAMRPFWIHQLAEYLIGVAIVAQGMQSPEPLVPTLAGALVIVNVAVARGPLGGFRLVGRGLHRWLDVVVMAVILFGALQPWVALDAGGRLIMLLLLVPLGFLWFYTDWAERPARRARRAGRADAGGEQIGRSAGRMAGNAVNAIKKRSR